MTSSDDGNEKLKNGNGNGSSNKLKWSKTLQNRMSKENEKLPWSNTLKSRVSPN